MTVFSSCSKLIWSLRMSGPDQISRIPSILLVVAMCERQYRSPLSKMRYCIVNPCRQNLKLPRSFKYVIFSILFNKSVYFKRPPVYRQCCLSEQNKTDDSGRSRWVRRAEHFCSSSLLDKNGPNCSPGTPFEQVKVHIHFPLYPPSPPPIFWVGRHKA